MTRLAVTGASGFIGRSIRRYLAETDHAVLCIDVTPSVAFPRERWEVLDLLGAQSAELRATLVETRLDAVINCAGIVEGSVLAMARANGVLPHRLVQLLGDGGVRLVHVGSAAEYGQRHDGAALSETDEPAPVTPYAVTKLTGSLAVADAAGRGADAVVLRLFNPLGPNMPRGSMPGRAAQLIREAAARDADEIVMGPLDARRDFIDLRDAADAIVRAATGPRLAAPILNLGTGTAHQARELVRTIASIADWGGRIREDPSLASPRSVGIDAQVAEIGAIQQALNWAPRHTFSEAAASVLESTTP